MNFFCRKCPFFLLIEMYMQKYLWFPFRFSFFFEFSFVGGFAVGKLELCSPRLVSTYYMSMYELAS